MKLSDFTFAPVPAAAAPAEAGAAASSPPVLARIERQLAEGGGRVAVTDGDRSLTWAELDRESARLAHFLIGRGVGRDSFVGIMLERSVAVIVAILGIWRAGGAYVPIDPALPLSRRRTMIEDCGVRLLLGECATLAALNALQWECDRLDDVVCLDVERFDAAIEPAGELMSTDLWDYIGAEATDEIQGGGWKSPYTGEWLSREVMQSYADNARVKLAPLVGRHSRVLEIGCASGITLRAVAPLVGSYLATDLSAPVLRRAKLLAQAEGIDNVSFRCLRADEIGELPAGAFDLIILNSVIESFPGHGYLRHVLDLALERLAPGGHMFLGNLWDLDRRDALLASLSEFARDHAGQGFTTKLDFSNELFVSRAFFADWAAEQAEAGRPVGIEASAMLADDRELAAYGFDLIVTKGARHGAAPAGKRRWGAGAIASCPVTPPDRAPAGSDAAYAIFTSGTTGRPKGTVIEHGNLVPLLDALEAQVVAPLSARGPVAVALLASVSFDASLQQIVPALAGGHRLVVVPADIRRDPARLDAFLTEHGVDLSDGTPSLFTLLLDHWERNGGASRVRTFILGGEVLRPELVTRFFANPRHLGARLVNAYGPTECTVDATLMPLGPEDGGRFAVIPIGRPLPGTEILILDPHGRPLPDGVPGQIVIAGPNVGRGYVNDAALTAARFVAHPFDGSRRAYLSGDIGRRRPNGLIEFVGREDGQVKVRGYRIECGEVEAVLRAHPAVRAAAVAAEDVLGDGQLVLCAWVVTDDSTVPAGLAEHLRHRLPDWMVPSIILPIDKLPLTLSGKLDRAALPKPSADNAGRAAGRPPATPTEHALAEIWADLLRLSAVSADDDFFQLGGHSVLAVRLMARIETAFGVRLGLDRLFSGSSLEALARAIDAARDGTASRWSPLVTARAEGRLPPLFCFHPVGGNILCYQHLARALGPDQPVHMLQSPGLESSQTPLDSVEAMAAAYIEAIEPVAGDRPVALAGWSFGGLVAYETARQLDIKGRRVTAVVLIDTVAVPDRVADLFAQDRAGYYATLFAEVMTLDVERLRALDEEAQLDLLITEGRRQGVFPPDIDRDGLLRLLALFRANGRASMAYRAPAVDRAVLLIRPHEISPAALSLADDPLQGWGDRARGGVRLAWVPGSHGSMLMPPHIDEVAAHVSAWLTEAAAKGGRVA